jgi:hypothetical protein
MQANELGSPFVDLLERKTQLKRWPKAARQALALTADELASGYHLMRETAPRRQQAYFSDVRTGITASSGASNRAEEHLAAKLFRGKTVALPDGKHLRLLDYQFPLKAMRTDAGIGKVDLLGLNADGRLVVVELKGGGNTEDRRIALVEGLIYAAIIEANIDLIANEAHAKFGFFVAPDRPAILLIGPHAYWADPRPFPTTSDMVRLAARVSAHIPIEISAMCLEGANLAWLPP